MSVAKQSFAHYKDNNTIEEGDLVILYLGKENMQLLRIQSGQRFICKFGDYSHSEMIGLEFGSKLGSNTGRGFLYLLYPTPELWTMVLPHRTQILYVADISFVMNSLGLKPGMSMIESGTGSGSFSHSIARTVGKTGHLYSFEYHEERVKAATKEFEEHGLSDTITIQCRDVCKNGFGLENTVEAAPWEAVASAKAAFKQDKMGRICTFSPCIEQISKTVTALSENGFVDIQMYECLIRYQDIRIVPVLTIDEALERERALEKKRKRAVPRALRESAKTALGVDSDKNEDNQDSPKEKKNKILGSETSDSNQSSTVGTPMSSDLDMNSTSVSTTPATPVLSSETEIAPPNSSMTAPTTCSALSGSTTSLEAIALIAEPREEIEPRNTLATKLPMEQRGHTSYLLFATFTPAIQRLSIAEQNAAASTQQ
ncbi:tRNA (adenine-N(1)-)-methyltransferase catalytic subunit trm61 [Lunasporangiospora selenospora]|uniref:tRNA (adenine(58)-N(1))-methyltransferase catalytic subunit TRM61 n=1 Tax=Lunasporangiospora selenospora TaxID=979761 RepID=A0A9P6KCL7_9FUNG|nr:tRNA (adenine-N(1)-)-methyltransferase catalytic subunit trm61 [Lunasporangiospora selenospora]